MPQAPSPNGTALNDALQLRPRQLSAEQLDRFSGYAAEIFAALGMDVTAPASADTPRRFIRALVDATEGYEGDPKLLRVFDAECPGDADGQLSQVVEGPIQFFSLCEHHALPFHGRAFVGYFAGDKIIGLSKLSRMVRVFARRFSIQERLGRQIADCLEATLDPRGVAVFLEARHLCTQMRGVREAEPFTRTTTWHGVYADNPALRAEFLTACGLRG